MSLIPAPSSALRCVYASQALAFAALESVVFKYTPVCTSHERAGSKGGGLSRWLRMKMLIDGESEDEVEGINDSKARGKVWSKICAMLNSHFAFFVAVRLRASQYTNEVWAQSAALDWEYNDGTQSAH